RCAQGSDPEAASRPRDAGDHPLQGPGRDDAQGVVGDDVESAHATIVARTDLRSAGDRSRDQRADGKRRLGTFSFHHGTRRGRRGIGCVTSATRPRRLTMMAIASVVYALGVVVGLLVMRDRPITRLVTALLWPIGPVTGLIVTCGLLVVAVV